MWTAEIGNASPVTVTYHGRRGFTVRYGEATKERLTYGEAATELGACILHAMACEGLLREEGQ